MATQKTPGVYVIEQSLFPPSVAEIATAIPAFIGYTEFAKDDDGKSLNLVPTKVISLLEYESYFGKGYNPSEYKVFTEATPKNVDSVAPDARFYLYDCLRLYFANGGGNCYIVSVKNYSDVWAYDETEKKYKGDIINYNDLSAGIERLAKYDEPTLILFPDAIGIKDNGISNIRFTENGNLQQDALRQCARLQDRFTIMDVMDGFKGKDPLSDPLQQFRDKVGKNNLSYGAVYYPWVKASFLPEIRWNQLKLYDNVTKAEIILADITFKDAAYMDYWKKMNNNQAIQDEIKLLSDGKTTIQEKLESIIDDMNSVSSDDAKKSRLSAYFRKLSDIVNYIRTFTDDTEPSEDLKKILLVLKKDTGVQDLIKDLIGFNKGTDVIKRILEDADGIYGLYKDFFEPPPTSEWVAKTAYDSIPPVTNTYSSTQQLNVIRELKLQKIPDKITDLIYKISDEAADLLSKAQKLLMESHPFFKTAVDQIKDHMRLLPPSGAVAGIYASVDRTRGVWKAPANVSINSVIGPAVKIDNKDQEDMNVHTSGKSINAIRAFTGKGTLVWGARTLAGNDNEWRYIPVRRFFNMVEKSVKKATEPFTFEPNDKNTWVKVKAMIENYLTLQWRAGALQGAKTEDAYFVHVGLSETMTTQDILEGRMIIEIGMAVVRPAEFIILRFSHKMNEK